MKNQNKKVLGLIGFPLEHSFSQKFFAQKFKTENIIDFEYRNFSISNIDKFPDLIAQNPNICGLNVTIPYKKKIIPFLDYLDETAQKIGAVNTVNFEMNNGKLITKGYNTDVYGFEKSLLPFLKNYHNKALILGTGGASNAVAYVLEKLGIDFKHVSRKANNNSLCYNNINLELLNEYFLIINTTPLGMFPNVNSFPNIPYLSLNEKHILFDLVYNPIKTEFLKKGEKQKAKIINGQKMLELQALKAWEIWRNN